MAANASFDPWVLPILHNIQTIKTIIDPRAMDSSSPVTDGLRPHDFPFFAFLLVFSIHQFFSYSYS
ncbi:hypothetical protein BO99DRAFT_111261 [Aspergillus violaceofuscus CBS 115571]|uniref:Uncharacterized protein n=1 Tax=Aspergillus violaceofuscus (strain CBS 115571) TaxID=1450538 RepID=A0A2V5I8S7_ASPV1|nr:hypothetical protein BO99DRAFT_111261 [Aspergillus violaceofuscus CBS 115571]